MIDDWAKGGWVKFYRQTTRSAVWAKPELLKLWCLCLLKANHEAKWVDIDGLAKPVRVMPGQFITGRFSLHKDYYRRRKRKAKSPGTVWNWLQTLRNMANLTLESNNRFTLVTICNWGKYQSVLDKNEQANQQQADNRLTADCQQAVTNKNDKNVEELKPSPPAGTHRAFIDWFCEQYLVNTGVKYDFQDGRDGAAVKGLISAYSPEDLMAMTDAMFLEKYGKENASPHLLWNQRNKWKQAAAPRQELDHDAGF